MRGADAGCSLVIYETQTGQPAIGARFLCCGYRVPGIPGLDFRFGQQTCKSFGAIQGIFDQVAQHSDISPGLYSFKKTGFRLLEIAAHDDRDNAQVLCVIGHRQEVQGLKNLHASTVIGVYYGFTLCIAIGHVRVSRPVTRHIGVYRVRRV